MSIYYYTSYKTMALLNANMQMKQYRPIYLLYGIGSFW